MSSEQRTLLHVVYAGRGDALILEYTTVSNPKRYFLLIDGGPPDESGIPYYKYLFQAIKDVWSKRQSGQNITVDAIFCSHPHSDHSEGLKYILNSMGDAASLLTFSGPFVMPSVAYEEATELTSVLTKLHFAVQAAGWTPTRLPGITVDFPSDDKILVFMPSSDKPEAIDTDEVNLASILMYTDPAATVGAGQVYFTGDNVGHTIATKIAPAGQPRKTFPIYKIQHHGSKNNSSINTSLRGISVEVERECAVFFILSHYVASETGAVSLVPVLGDIPPSALAIFGQRMRGIIGDLPAVEAYLNELVTRQDRYKAAIIGSNVVSLLEAEAAGPFPPALPTPNDLMVQVRSWVLHLEDTDGPFPEFYDITAPYRKPLSWWADSSWQNSRHFCPQFQRLLPIPGIREFYNSFDAEAYVISANHVFRHPTEATLIGLGLAVRDRQRSATVYLTEGETVNSSAIVKLCLDATGGTITANQLFDPSSPHSLRIRYKSTGFYFTLDGAGAAMANREVTNRTAAISFSTDTVTRESLRNKLETDTTYLPLRKAIAPTDQVTYSVYCLVESTKWYLDLQSKAPLVTGSKTFMVVYDGTDNDWPAPSPSASDGETYIHVMQTTSDSPPQRIFGMSFALGTRTGRTSWQLIWQAPVSSSSSATEKTTFYFDATTGGIVVDKYQDPPPAKYKLTPVQFQFINNSNPAMPSFAMRPHTTALPTLKDYYTSTDLVLPSPLPCQQALLDLVGSNVLEQLDLTLSFETAVLGWSLDPYQSTVDFDDEGIAATVHGVELVFILAPGTTIPFDNQNLKVLSVSLSITWPDDTSNPETPFQLDLIVVAERSVTLSCHPTLLNVERITSLKKCLLGMGVTTDALNTITVPKLLGFIIYDYSSVVNALLDLVPSFLVNAGLPLLKPDWANSTVDASWNPLGNVTISRADIVCVVSGVSGWALQNIAGIALTMGSLNITATDTLTPNQQLSLTGSASFTNVAEAEGIALTFSCVLGSDQSELVFSISGTDSVSALSTLLPGVPDLTQLQTPFSASALGQMTSSLIGFSVSQAVTGMPTYDLSSVFVIVNFDDWKQFLPSTFPIAGIDQDSVVIRVLVLEPRNADTTLVGVNIDYSVHLDSPLPPLLTVNLSANPLVTTGSYEFRLTVGAAPVRALGAGTGLTLANLCQAIGMADISSSIGNAIPILGQVLTAIELVELSVSVLKQASASTPSYVFGDWRLSLYVDGFVIVPNILTITQATMNMTSIGGLFSCEVNGSIMLSSADTQTIVNVFMKTPTPEFPGQVRIDAPSELSIANVMSAFGFPDLTSVPVIGSLISVAVDSVDCSLGYPEGSTDVACLGVAIDLGLDTLDLGILSLVAITLSIEYHAAEDLLGPGSEQKAFSISSLLADGTLSATVAYNSLKGTLTASLVQTEPLSLTLLLQDILPSMVVNALSGLIGNMSFDHADLVLDTTNYSIQSFSIALTSVETLDVGSLVLSALSVDYVAAGSGTQPTPETLVVRGVIQQGDVGVAISISCISDGTVASAPLNSTVKVEFTVTPLTPTSLPLLGFINILGLPFPTYTKPADCPSFDALQVTDVSGQITVTTVSTSSSATSTTLEIDSLSARVVTLPGSGIDILPVLGIQLTQVMLSITYADSQTSGSVSGYLPISGIGGVWVLFSLQDGQELYAADLNLGTEEKMDATDIYHTFLTADEWNIPTNLNVPSALPLADIHARVTRNVSIDVWGFGTTGSGTGTWEIAASGVELSTASLGGRIHIMEPAAQSIESTTNAERQYDVYIIGTVSFTGFSGANAAEARLNIKSNDGVTFTAGITKTGSGSDLNTLSEELDTNPGSNWDSILPLTTSSISLDQTGISVYANFTKDDTRFAMYGSVTGIGYLLLLGRPNLTAGSPGRSYFVSLVITDLGAVWSDFSNIMGFFDFDELAVYIMAYDGELIDIYTDLKSLVTDFAAGDVVVPDTSIPVAPMLKDYGKTTLGNGAFFSGTISLSSQTPKPMTGGFTMASDPSSTGVVNLWALVPHDPTSTVFGIIMTDFTLLGGAVVINGSGTYVPDNLTIKEASLVLSIPGAPAPLAFEVGLTVTPDETSFSVLTSSLTLPSPFGNMFSVTFNNLGITGEIMKVQEKPSATYSISTTSVLLGGSSTGLGGSIIFPEGKPQVAVLDAMNMGILDVFTKIIQYDPGSGSTPGSWPAVYNPFTVTKAVIYYNNGAEYTTASGITYQSNYNINAELSIFGVEFSLDLNIPSRAGVKVTGTYIGTIDFKFVQLGPYPPSAPTTSGPTLSIDTTTSTTVYKYESAVTFFGLEGLDLALQYTKDGDEDIFSGTLQYDGTVLGVPNPSISASYNSSTDEWSFGPWPIIQDLGNAIDIMKEIVDMSATQACKTLVGLALDNVTVKVSPNLKLTSGTDASNIITAGAEPYLMITFDVTFSLNVAKTQICSLTLPNDQLIPPQKMTASDFDTSSLQSFVLSVFVQFAKNLALAVLENPVALGALIAQMAILDFGEDLVTNLLCRGCDNPDLETAARNWADKNHSDAGDSGDDSHDDFRAVLNAVGIGLATSIFASGVSLLDTTQNILGQLASLVDKFTSIFGVDSGLEQQLNDITDLVNKLLGDKATATNFLNAALDMGGIPHLTWGPATGATGDEPQTSVSIDWSQALPNSQSQVWYEGYNGFQWIVRANTTGGINDPGTVTYTETDSSKRAFTLHDDDFAYNTTIYVWVTSTYGEFGTSDMPPAASISHVPFLYPPSVTLGATTSGLAVKFSGQSAPVVQETYKVQVAGSDVASRQLVIFDKTVPDATAPVAISWDAFTPTSPMPASVCAYVQAVSSDPSKAHDSVFAASTAYFTVLPLPTSSL